MSGKLNRVVHLFAFFIRQNSKEITESQRLEETFGDHLVLKQVLYSRLHNKVSRQVLNIFRVEDSTAWGSLFHYCCPQSKEALPRVHMELLMFLCVPIRPSSVDGHNSKEPVSINLTPTYQIFMGIDKPPSQSSLAQALVQSQVSQPFLIREILQAINHPCSPLLDFLAVLCHSTADVTL